jgi:predicted transcriptional regulator
MAQHDEARGSIPTAHARIEPALRQRLEALAERNDRSLAGEIRQAIREHVEREQPAGSGSES